jgi:predicted DNA-binding protein
MATKKGAKKMPAIQDEKMVKAVRLDLTPADHERLNRQAKKRGLTMASYARMVILANLDEEEGGK